MSQEDPSLVEFLSASPAKVHHSPVQESQLGGKFKKVLKPPVINPYIRKKLSSHHPESHKQGATADKETQAVSNPCSVGQQHQIGHSSGKQSTMGLNSHHRVGAVKASKR